MLIAAGELPAYLLKHRKAFVYSLYRENPFKHLSVPHLALCYQDGEVSIT